MSGSFDVDPNVSPAGQAAPVVCCLFDGTGYTPLQNVACEGIQWNEGADPPTARFRYFLDIIAAAQGYPTEFEQLFPLDASGFGVVQPDDRIVVLTFSPYGDPRVLFDGHVQVPQVDLAPSSQSVTFTAVHVAARCFDLPVGGRKQRDSSQPTVTGSPVQTDLPTRFNPFTHEGITRPNCTAPTYDENSTDPPTAYPVFLDELLKRSPDPRVSWTLSGAVRYLAGVWNDERFVDDPDFSSLDDLLKNRYALDGAQTYNPGDPASFQGTDIVVRDYDATDKGWPEAIAELVGRSGFGFRWRTGTNSNGLPVHTWEVYRTDAGQTWAPKSLWLLPTQSGILDGPNTAASLHLARDVNGLVNGFSVETPPRRVETSIVLAPGFVPAAGDETAANVTAFKSANLGAATTTVRNKYRLWIADETGEGHWDLDASITNTAELDLRPIFPPDSKKNPTYVVRNRPGSHKLITVDSAGKERRAALHVSRDYTGARPGVWDGTGTWQEIAGGWKLLDDRLGIYITAEDPEAWPIGQSTTATVEKSKTLRGVTSIANPAAPNTKFTLRLTTVIDDDIMLPAVVGARVSSPTRFTRQRRVDAKDHYLLETVSQTSCFCPTPIGTAGAKDVVARDDTDKALAHARQLQAAHEMPRLAGSATVPWLTTTFEVGDRVKLVRGREVTLRTNAGAEQGEAPHYPRVVSVAWSFAGDSQQTVIQFSDRRGEPAKA